MSMRGGCNYYVASPMKPGENIKNLALPPEMLSINIPTQVIWGIEDIALRPELLDGLDDYIADLRIHKVEDATHWITHEQPELVKQLLTQFLNSN